MSDSIFETVKDRESPLAEQAAEQISQLIIDRQLTNGEKLPNEFELAEQLNVGRGTVREAVKLLVARNVLEIRRGRGTFVAHQTGVVHDPLGFAYMPDQLRLAHELLDIRLNVEPWVASLAAQQATAEDVVELRALCLEVEALIHAGENHLRRDEALHVRIARCTQNRVVCKLLPVITYSVQLFGKLIAAVGKLLLGAVHVRRERAGRNRTDVFDLVGNEIGVGNNDFIGFFRL